MKTIDVSITSIEKYVIKYLITDNSDLHILQNKQVEAYIKYDNCESFDFDLTIVPKSILYIPISLYLLPITYFYNVDVIVPEMDKVLYGRLNDMYEKYSKIYGPFSEEWSGKFTMNKIEENTNMMSSAYENIVFFSGGADACSAGLNNPGKETVLVSIPSIESLAKEEGELRMEKFSLIREFSKLVDSSWIVISNNFNRDVFNDNMIQTRLSEDLKLNSSAFKFDGWFGIKYLANMCSVAPFAYSQGVKKLVMGSAFEQEEDNKSVNYDGANPELSDSISFAGTKFSEQDEIYTRRTKKVANIISKCNAMNKKTKIWTCFSDSSIQCGQCAKCVRTQLNILCANANPKDWGFENFSDKAFTKYIKKFSYWEKNACWLWDIIDSINDNTKYVCCNELLHWLKKIGYKEYLKKASFKKKFGVWKKLLKIYKYPHYVRSVLKKFRK